MRLKAIHLCEDVRLEASGTLNYIGVFNERLRVFGARSQQGALVIPKLAIVCVVAGLSGATKVGSRFRTRRPGEADPPPQAFTFEAHEPTHDEHNFAVVQAPMRMPGEGAYEVIFDIEAKGETQSYRYGFTVEHVT